MTHFLFLLPRSECEKHKKRKNKDLPPHKKMEEEKPNNSAPPDVAPLNADTSSNGADAKLLEEENLKLKEQRLCKVLLIVINSYNMNIGNVSYPSAKQRLPISSAYGAPPNNTNFYDQQICMDEEVSIVLLPCGHLVSCVKCAPALRKCPICRNGIKGTVRTFMA